MSFVFVNNVQTTLSSSVSSTSTTLILSSSANLPVLGPSQLLAITLNDAATGLIYEICYITAISGNTLTVLRAQEGTSAQNWNIGDNAYCAWTAGTVTPFLTLPYSIAAGVSGSISGNQIVLFFLADVAISVPANFSGSFAEVLTPFTTAAIYQIYHNSTLIGNFSFAAGASVATFSSAPAFILSIGDKLTVQAPSTVDASAQNLAITIHATQA